MVGKINCHQKGFIREEIFDILGIEWCMYFSKREKKGKNRHTRQITSKVKSNDTVKVIGAVRAQNMRKRIRREVSGTKPDKGTKCYFRAEYSHYVNSQPLMGFHQGTCQPSRMPHV